MINFDNLAETCTERDIDQVDEFIYDLDKKRLQVGLTTWGLPAKCIACGVTFDMQVNREMDQHEECSKKLLGFKILSDGDSASEGEFSSKEYYGDLR